MAVISNIDIISISLGTSRKEAIRFFQEVNHQFDTPISTYKIAGVLRSLPTHKRNLKQVVIVLSKNLSDEPELKLSTANESNTSSLNKTGLSNDRIDNSRNLQQRKKSKRAKPKTETVKHKISELQKWNILYFYHITSMSNLEAILKNGLLSHNEAYRRGLIVNDISMKEIQNRRKYKRDTIYRRLIHNYASLYFSPRNPMLYKRKDIQCKLAILGINPELIFKKNTIFSDGNAAANNTKFYQGVSQLDQLSWHIINDPWWIVYPDGKRIKCAEILVYPEVEIKYINKIFCYDLDHKEICSKISNDTVPIEIDRNLYF